MVRYARPDGGCCMKRCLLIAPCVVLGGLGTYLGQSFLQGQARVVPVTPKELTSYRDIVKRVLPAVVSIESQSKSGKPGRSRPGDMQGPGERPRFLDLPQPVDEDGPARIGFGSGFIVDPKGVI